MNEQNEKNLFDASKCFELIENITQASCCGNERHVQNDVNEEDKKLEDIEESKVEFGVMEDIISLTNFTEDSKVNIEERYE